MSPLIATDEVPQMEGQSAWHRPGRLATRRILPEGRVLTMTEDVTYWGLLQSPRQLTTLQASVSPESEP